MRRIFTYILVLLASILASQKLYADEGMWMVNTIDKALEKKMKERGLKLNAREIYNADAEGASLTDAIVSLDFGCSGSVVSDNGLVITNHHCAYGDVHKLSTPEHNYLEEGFWAMKAEDEVNIEGKKMFFLKKVLDVTDEVLQLTEEQQAEGKPFGFRRLSSLIEKKYSKETGLTAWLSSMWSGSKYYLALYEVYSDIRLVAAPPVSLAAFGGDTDNWEWPQHKCDFAFYRIYTAPDGKPAEYSPDNIPLKSKKKLKISIDGYKPGDFAMVIGYPGMTDRYSSSAEVLHKKRVTLPISNRLRGEQMSIVSGWMNEDPNIRLKYADYYFSLSNVQEMNCGEVFCFNRFEVVAQKDKLEKELQAWVEESEERKTKWGETIALLDSLYLMSEGIEKNKVYYRETLIRGSQLGLIIRRAYNSRNPQGTGKRMLSDYENIDLRVEKDLISYALHEYINNIDSYFWSDFQKEVIAQYTNDGICDTKALAEELWSSSLFTNAEDVERMYRKKVSPEEIQEDRLAKFLMSVAITDFNSEANDIVGDNRLVDLRRDYTNMLYEMRLEKGVPQYPDANSTMRLTYGTVGGLEPCDAVIYSHQTTTTGILEKYDPNNYDFNLNDKQLKLYRKGDWGRWNKNGKMPVNFLTNNDITGGNSGSPVLNGKGELIGLAFDGNKESLASDACYTPDYNKCVCVDIRFVLWTLDKYAGMTELIKELGF